MSVTGIALVLFLTFHASMNVVALISAQGYNMICEFLGANWYAVVATLGLAALVALHFVYAFWLTLQNRKARGNNRYAVTDKPEAVEWASQNMLVLGIIMILDPFGTMETLVMAIGVILIVEGALNLLSALYTVIAVKRFLKLHPETQSMLEAVTGEDLNGDGIVAP